MHTNQPEEQKQPKEFTYNSHVLWYPKKLVANGEEHCFPTFLGEFVTPLAQANPELMFWFSHYGQFARFRVWTDRYEELRPELEKKRDLLDLTDKGEEKNLTLEGDLGGARFIGPDSVSNSKQRSLKILRSLYAASELVLDSIYKLPNGLWRFEAAGDPLQNPVGNHLFSVNHLFHNLTRSQGRIAVFLMQQQTQVASYYYYRNAVKLGKLTPQNHQLVGEYSVEM